jgi:hypothetical protein
MTTDGKYCTLDYLKQWIIGSRTDPLNPTVFNGAVSGTPDDALLTNCILDAETRFEQITGTGYDEHSLTMVQAFTPFVTPDGFIHLFARERGPVSAVSAIQYRDIAGGVPTWQTLTWATDDIILPYQNILDVDAHPSPDSWHVRVYAPTLGPRSTGQILARWSYTGGYTTTPLALMNLIAGFATWIYKLRREAPLGVVSNQALGTFSAPLNVPPDILATCNNWKPVYS